MTRPTTSASLSHGVAATTAAVGSGHEPLSALVDGELSEGDLAALLDEVEPNSSALRATWASYQLIGDALRGGAPQVGDPARVRAIMARVQAEVRPQPAVEAPAATAVLSPHPVPVQVLAHDAANDAVFRWRLVAGFAAMTAAVAVAWNMVGSDAGMGGAAPQLAQQSAPAAPVLPAQSTAPVLVAGEQGPVLRDPRLEELMAAHRQAGGMSALQMPAGFLRNAAFDLPEGQR